MQSCKQTIEDVSNVVDFELNEDILFIKIQKVSLSFINLLLISHHIIDIKPNRMIHLK